MRLASVCVAILLFAQSGATAQTKSSTDNKGCRLNIYDNCYVEETIQEQDERERFVQEFNIQSISLNFERDHKVFITALSDQKARGLSEDAILQWSSKFIIAREFKNRGYILDDEVVELAELLHSLRNPYGSFFRGFYAFRNASYAEAEPFLNAARAGFASEGFGEGNAAAEKFHTEAVRRKARGSAVGNPPASKKRLAILPAPPPPIWHNTEPIIACLWSRGAECIGSTARMLMAASLARLMVNRDADFEKFLRRNPEYLKLRLFGGETLLLRLLDTAYVLRHDAVDKELAYLPATKLLVELGARPAEVVDVYRGGRVDMRSPLGFAAVFSPFEVFQTLLDGALENGKLQSSGRGWSAPLLHQIARAEIPYEAYCEREDATSYAGRQRNKINYLITKGLATKDEIETARQIVIDRIQNEKQGTRCLHCLHNALHDQPCRGKLQ